MSILQNPCVPRWHTPLEQSSRGRVCCSNWTRTPPDRNAWILKMPSSANSDVHPSKSMRSAMAYASRTKLSGSRLLLELDTDSSRSERMDFENAIIGKQRCPSFKIHAFRDGIRLSNKALGVASAARIGHGLLQIGTHGF